MTPSVPGERCSINWRQSGVPETPKWIANSLTLRLRHLGPTRAWATSSNTSSRGDRYAKISETAFSSIQNPGSPAPWISRNIPRLSRYPEPSKGPFALAYYARRHIRRLTKPFGCSATQIRGLRNGLAGFQEQTLGVSGTVVEETSPDACRITMFIHRASIFLKFFKCLASKLDGLTSRATGQLGKESGHACRLMQTL